MMAIFSDISFKHIFLMKGLWHFSQCLTPIQTVMQQYMQQYIHLACVCGFHAKYSTQGGKTLGKVVVGAAIIV